MNVVVFKYKLSLTSLNHFSWPFGSTILSIQAMKGDPVMWVEHPQGQSAVEERAFYLTATGHEFFKSIADTYRETVQLAGGRVAHVYETRTPY